MLAHPTEKLVKVEERVCTNYAHIHTKWHLIVCAAIRGDKEGSDCCFDKLVCEVLKATELGAFGGGSFGITRFAAKLSSNKK